MQLIEEIRAYWNARPGRDRKGAVFDISSRSPATARAYTATNPDGWIAFAGTARRGVRRFLGLHFYVAYPVRTPSKIEAKGCALNLSRADRNLYTAGVSGKEDHAAARVWRRWAALSGRISASRPPRLIQEQ